MTLSDRLMNIEITQHCGIKENVVTTIEKSEETSALEDVFKLLMASTYFEYITQLRFP